MSQNRRNRRQQGHVQGVDRWLNRLTVRNWMLLWVVLCQVATILITWTVWRVRDQPMNLPLFRLLAPLGESPALNALGPLLLVSLAVALVRPRIGVVLHAVIYLIALVFDQYRLQPQFFSLIVLMFACAFERGVWFGRWYLATMWLWTGAHKLLSAEWMGVRSHSFLAHCGIEADEWHVYFAIVVGASEVSLGILAVFAPRKAIPLCIAVHLGILFLLSPLLANHNESVWPWNLATAVVGAWILAAFPSNAYDGLPSPPATGAQRLRQSVLPQKWLRFAIVATMLIVPAGYYFDWVNSRLSFVLYSGNLPRALHSSPERLKRLDGWTGLTVPFPNSPRLFVQVFEKSAEPGDKLYVSDPRWWVADRHFLKDAQGTVQEITRERFYREVPDTGELTGVEFDSENAVWHLRNAGAMLVEDDNGMMTSANLQGAGNGDRQFEYLRQLPNLQEIKAEGTAVTNQGIQALAGLRRLEILEIEGGPVTGDCLTVARDLPALSWLRLSDVAIKSEELAALRDLRQIQTLHFPGTHVDDAALAHIATLTKLQWLDLSDTRVTGRTLDELESLDELDWINLSGTPVHDSSLQRLGRLRGLEIVQLSGTKITDRGLDHLSSLTECRTLELEGTNITDAGLPALAALDNVQVLNLRGTKVTENGVQLLEAALAGCRIDW